MNRIIYCCSIAAFIYIISSCAKIGSPTGGPVDEDPPTIVGTNPPENSTHFNPQKKIIISFDEFVVLENIFQELIISPPLEGRMIAFTRNKNIVVEFPEEAVFDTTTYTLSFGKSITDNNEGNILNNYEFVFSLSAHIDSMNVEGKIVNAFDHKPDEEPMFVMLYNDLSDSVPLKEKPKYISRTDKTGEFLIHNLETGRYRLFALKDQNNNMMFDLPEEQIAFSDSILELTPGRFKDDIIIPDTLSKPNADTRVSVNKNADDSKQKRKTKKQFEKESTTQISDSVNSDSIQREIRKYSYFSSLYFFNEEEKNEYLTNSLRSSREKLTFTFYKSLSDSFQIRPLNHEAGPGWYIADFNTNYDTLNFWLTDTSMIHRDSLYFEVSYPVYDSLKHLVPFTDSLWLVFQTVTQKEGRKGRRGQSKIQPDTTEQTAPAVKYLTLTDCITNRGAFDLDRSIVISTATPAFELKPENIVLYRIQDSLEIPVKTKIYRQPGSLYQSVIEYKPEELTNYKLFIPEGAFTDIYGTSNDTTIIPFTTQAEDFYGILTLSLNNVTSPVILQLLDDQECPVKENRISSDQKIRYEYLYPLTYKLKLIIDSNNNGKWDTGNYLEHRQPEEVIYYNVPVNVRSNWEMELNWDLE